MPWYDSALAYRQKLTIAAAQVDADLVDFPVMINQDVVQTSLFTHAKADGSDLVVTATDGTTKLKRELVHYNAGGELELYVRVPSVLAANDTELYLYYGNAAAAEPNDADTWGASFGLVLHFAEDPETEMPGAADSTVNGNHGNTDLGTVVRVPNDLWSGHAARFDISDGEDRMVVADDASYDPTDRITIEVWFKPTTWANRGVLLRKENSFIMYNYEGGFSWYIWGPGSRLQYDVEGDVPSGSWGYVAGTYDQDGGADNQKIYLDGVEVASVTRTGVLNAATSNMGIGREISGAADGWDGLIDEVRISTVVRSDAWLKATWRNLSAPPSFLSAGAEETEGGGAVPVRRPIVIAVAT